MKPIFKKCKKHGIVEHEINKVINNKIYYKCKPCKNSRKSDIRKENKTWLVDYMGGKCEICSYDRTTSALEMHHINPLGKTIEFSRIGRDSKLENYKNEIHNTPCIMLCATCHREVHEGLILILESSHSSTG